MHVVFVACNHQPGMHQPHTSPTKEGGCCKQTRTLLWCKWYSPHQYAGRGTVCPIMFHTCPSLCIGEARQRCNGQGLGEPISSRSRGISAAQQPESTGAPSGGRGSHCHSTVLLQISSSLSWVKTQPMYSNRTSKVTPAAAAPAA
jgi:hypothetical protein